MRGHNVFYGAIRKIIPKSSLLPLLIYTTVMGIYQKKYSILKCFRAPDYMIFKDNSKIYIVFVMSQQKHVVTPIRTVSVRQF